MCKILFSLLREFQNADSCFASEKKNSINLKYIVRIYLIICPTRRVIALILEPLSIS